MASAAVLIADPTATVGELAMRLLTRHDTGFRPRLIDAFHQLLQEASDAGRPDLPADLHEVSYVIVCIIESCTYRNIIASQEPRIDKAVSVLRLLVR